MLNKSLLMIAYKFPPMQSISCNRTWAIYRGMQVYFDSVHVVSTSNRHLLTQDDIDTSEVQIADAKTVDYRTLFQRRRESTVLTEKSKTSFFGRTVARMQSSMPTLHLFGEGNIIYTRNAIKAAEKILQTHHITHVFSTFPPYADHIIAAALKHAHPELFWIADFRDLHVDPAQDNLFWRNHQKKINQKVLQGANVVTTVSEGLATHLREFHQNVQVLPNGVREMPEQTPPLYPKFTISYTGSMFQDKRRPETLLAAIAQLLDKGIIKRTEFELLYAGKDSSVWRRFVTQYGLEDVFRDHGLLARKDAEHIQQRSHINILLTYSTSELKGNLTGKLYDYLSAQRPLLVLINGPADSEIENLISRTGAGVVIYHGDIDAVSDYLEKAYATWIQTHELPQQYHPDELNCLKWKNILGVFARRNELSII